MKLAEPVHPREIRLRRLYAAHAAVAKATKTADRASPDQADALGAKHTRTASATSAAYATVTMTASEARDLLALALPRSARTIPLKAEHALLMIAIAQLLDELAAITTIEVPYSAITAAQHLAHQARDWLIINNHVVMTRHDRMSDPMIGRPRSPDVQNRLPKGRPPAASPFASWHNYRSTAAGNGGLSLFSAGGKSAG